MTMMRIRIADGAKARYTGEILAVNALSEPYKSGEGGSMYHYEQVDVTGEQKDSLEKCQGLWKWDSGSKKIVNQDDAHFRDATPHPI